MRSTAAFAPCSRVAVACGSDWIDLPALEKIEMGKNAFRFRENVESSTLVLRSEEVKRK